MFCSVSRVKKKCSIKSSRRCLRRLAHFVAFWLSDWY